MGARERALRRLLAPLPLTRVMAENIRFMHGLGGRFYFTQAGRVSDVNPFLLYATTKLLWNPETDLDALLPRDIDSGDTCH